MAPEQGPGGWLYFLVYLSWGYKRRYYAGKYGTGENQPSASQFNLRFTFNTAQHAVICCYLPDCKF